MSKPLTKREREGISAAQEAVRRIVAATPTVLHGQELVAALAALLTAQSSEAKHLGGDLGAIGLAAAAIAMVVEQERAQARGERTVTA
jgi:hypothetical protein